MLDGDVSFARKALGHEQVAYRSEQTKAHALGVKESEPWERAGDSDTLFLRKVQFSRPCTRCSAVNLYFQFVGRHDCFPLFSPFNC